MKSQISNLKSQMAFTLIEVTIAITLLSFIMLILYGAFYLGHRAVEKAGVRSEESQRLRSIGGLLGSYVRSAYPYRSSLKDPFIFFLGEEGRLTFVSALSVGFGGRGMSKVSISWEGEIGRAGFLTLEEEMPVRIKDEEDGMGYRNRIILQQGIRDLRIDYLATPGKEDGWVESWDGKEKKILPSAVRFNLKDDRGEEVRWVFPVMMSVLGQ